MAVRVVPRVIRASLRVRVVTGAFRLATIALFAAAAVACSGGATVPPGAARNASGAVNASASAAKTCEELVSAAAQVTRAIVADLRGKTEADLRAADSADPFAELLRPYDAYRQRATALGCDPTELVRSACREYQDITPTGPVAEEFMARVADTCR